MRKFIKISSLFLIFLTRLVFGQKTISWDLGLSGLVHGVQEKPFRYIKDTPKIMIYQSYFSRQDRTPFPAIAEGIFAEWMIHSDKKSIGTGYHLQLDYITLTNGAHPDYPDTSFSAKFMKHDLYIKYMLHLKHDAHNSVFVGIKTGFYGAAYTVFDRLSPDRIIEEPYTTRFRNVSYKNFYPGLFAGISAGFKFYILKNILSFFDKSSPFGIRLYGEYCLYTPTIAADSYRVRSSGAVTEPYKNSDKWFLNFSGLRIYFTVFFETERKKILKNKF